MSTEARRVVSRRQVESLAIDSTAHARTGSPTVVDSHKGSAELSTAELLPSSRLLELDDACLRPTLISSRRSLNSTLYRAEGWQSGVPWRNNHPDEEEEEGTPRRRPSARILTFTTTHHHRRHHQRGQSDHRGDHN